MKKKLNSKNSEKKHNFKLQNNTNINKPLKNEMIIELRDYFETRIDRQINRFIAVITIIITIVGILLGFMGPAFLVTKLKDSIKDKIELVINESRSSFNNTIKDFQNDERRASSMLDTIKSEWEEIKNNYINVASGNIKEKKVIDSIFQKQLTEVFDKKTSLFYLNKGIKEFNNQDLESIESFKMAFEYNPSQYEILYWIAKANKDITNNKEESEKYLKLAIEYGFKDKQRAMNDKFIDYLGNEKFSSLFENN